MADDTPSQRFTSLYDDTFARIAGFVARRSSSPEDAADAVAEAYLIAWRRWDRVPPGDAALYWLYATARFVLANQHRADAARSAAEQRLASGLVRFMSEAGEPVTQERLDASALNRLPSEWREVLLLTAWEGLNPAEIAAVIGCSPTAAKIRLYRARRLLGQLLGDDLPRRRIATVSPSGSSPARNRSCHARS